MSRLRALDDLVSPRTGIVRSVTAMSRPPAEPRPPHIWNASLSHFDFRRAPAVERASTGKGTTDDEARLGAIAEAIERYCGYHPRPDKFLRSPWTDLQPAALSPGDLVLYSDSQYNRPGFPYRRFHRDHPIAWISGYTLPDRRPIWLPAGFVYLNYFDDLLAPPDSTGLAAGPDLDSAVLSGFYEAIERHAFVTTWLMRQPAHEVQLETLGDLERAIARHYRRSDVQTRVWRLPAEQPAAVMMAAAIDRTGNGPAAAVGLGCHLDPRIAARKAIFEVCQVRPGVPAGAGQKFKGPSDVHTLFDHAGYFASIERLHEFDFLDGGPAANLTSRATGTTAGDLALLAASTPAAFVDVTTPDLVDYPIRVARVLAPGLQPIHFGFGQERLGNRVTTGINPCPHPLA